MNDRWRFKEDPDSPFNLIMTPNVPELASYINQVSLQVSQKIYDMEEKLVIEALPLHALTKLRDLCVAELIRRNATS